MKIIVIANVEMQKEFESKGIPEGIEIHFETSLSTTPPVGDAYFYLLDEVELKDSTDWIDQTNAPVFVNAVTSTLDSLPSNTIRINAWPGFIQRPLVEICTSKENASSSNKILTALSWNYEIVPDVIGMVAPKIISMIINEAYFALGDDVSNKEAIDTAMKLGTNYPYGPFEWSEIIGLNKIHDLLSTLSKTELRYLPAPFLIKDIAQ
jgi:3-hydroxybutyryl-CoA dehydrogenase